MTGGTHPSCGMLSVAVLLAMAVNKTGPDGVQSPVLFASPVRSASGVSAPAMARDRGVGPSARTLTPDRGRAYAGARQTGGFEMTDDVDGSGRRGGDQARWNASEWHGRTLIDGDGEKIGKLQDVYVDVETDEPQFATVKEGFIGRHLTLVPLGGVQIGPDELRVQVTKEQVRTAPDIEMHGEELSEADESDSLSPLRDELHADRYRERAPAGPTMTAHQETVVRIHPQDPARVARVPTCADPGVDLLAHPVRLTGRT